MVNTEWPRSRGCKMRTRRLARLAVCGIIGLIGPVAHMGPAGAGPFGPPNFGVMEPASDACPWPDFLNGYMQTVQGVQKCLPGSIAWASAEGGVRIVSDTLDATGVIPGATGQVTFWCQSKVGLRFIITVQGLAATTSYETTGQVMGSATVIDFGTIRTDMNGRGIVAGVIPLAAGEYDVHVFVGNVLQPDAGDPDIGFVVF